MIQTYLFSSQEFFRKATITGDTNRAKMALKSNSKQGDWKASSQSSGTLSETAYLQTSADFGSGLQKDTKEGKKCKSYIDDTPIDWDGLV